MSASIKEFHTQLTLEIRQGLAHHRLRAAQTAAGRRETPLVCGRDEGAQLVQRYTVEHISIPPINRSNVYRLASWTAAHQSLYFDGVHRFCRYNPSKNTGYRSAESDTNLVRRKTLRRPR